MEFEIFWQSLMDKLPAYALSHIYDITAYEIGILAAVLTSFIKDPIKKFNRENADEDRFFNYKRRNLLVALLSAFISVLIFVIFASFSERINVISGWTVTVAFVPVAVYTVIEMIDASWLSRIMVLVIAGLTIYGNIIYCLNKENHHKMCYAIRIMVFVFALTGIALQIFNKDKKNIKTEE